MGNNKVICYRHMTEAKLIYLVKPFMGLVPEVELPLRK